ncbi:hypothetical protein ACH5RR_026713 [Cinchona calisaya]|uniref:Uncharacterized protein n=1 Tax=Cinchona calisaya TaxID=153742 RepID=A0ABD2Z3D4_9GENT
MTQFINSSSEALLSSLTLAGGGLGDDLGAGSMMMDTLDKNIFLEVKKKFETAIGILRKEKTTIDLEDPAAVVEYAKVMNTADHSQNLKESNALLTAEHETSRCSDIPFDAAGDSD